MADMLIDQNYPNVLPLGREPLERGFDGGVVCLGVDYKEVLLVVWRRRDMLWVACVSRELSGLSRGRNAPQCQLGAAP